MPKVIVVHQGYGCESGCCGHVVEIDGEQSGSFMFDHPRRADTPETLKAWIIARVIEACGEEHVKDIDFDQCIVFDD